MPWLLLPLLFSCMAYYILLKLGDNGHYSLLFLVCAAPWGCRSNMAIDGLSYNQTLSPCNLPRKRTRRFLRCLKMAMPLPGTYVLAYFLVDFPLAWAMSFPIGWKWGRLPLCAAVAWTYHCAGDSRTNFLIFVGLFGLVSQLHCICRLWTLECSQ